MAGGAGALVGLPVGAGAWAESIPPVPDGFVVSVSFSTGGAAEEHGEALGMLGYRVVEGPAEPGRERAWMLVSSALAAARPAWWGEVSEQSDGVYSLAMGPVLHRFATLLRAHFGTG